MNGHATLMSSASDEWATPQDFYDVVARRFPFVLGVLTPSCPTCQQRREAA